MAAKVYFADMRSNEKQSLLDKVGKLYRRTGIGSIVAKNDLVAVKLHFGERGNTTYIRPQFIRRLVDLIRNSGGKPFLTDANTLYVGGRSNAVDHLETAVLHGFDYAVAGAPVIIADGLTGKDYVEVPVDLKHFKTVKIGSAAYHADALLVVSHFKGHIATAFGGVLKNVGMGLGSRSGKQMMHSDLLPEISPEKCRSCGRCMRWCPAGAISFTREQPDNPGPARIDASKCLGCGECTVTCTHGAIASNWKTEPDIMQEKIAEYSWGVLKDKKGKAAFITFLNNVTPDCDCCGWSEAPIVPDIGILASRDPIALDQACVDLVNGERGLSASRMAGHEDSPDKFRALFPNVDWSRQLAYGEELGLGIRQYQLVRVK
ncbi:MAG: DUF362 domain-containing protein [Candidatus Desulforudis sp.]|nr:DUF362 domain-containing protein [Desulforudis sp.]